MPVKYKHTRNIDFNRLSPKGRELCHQMVATGCGPKEAALQAGYDEMWASKNSYGYVQKPTVRAYLEYLKNQQVNRTAVDPDFVVKRLIRLADAAETEGKYNDAIRAMELLGKHYQMFQTISKQEIEVNNKNPFSVGESAVAKRAALHRLSKITGGFVPQGIVDNDGADEGVPEDEKIH